MHVFAYANLIRVFASWFQFVYVFLSLYFLDSLMVDVWCKYCLCSCILLSCWLLVCIFDFILVAFYYALCLISRHYAWTHTTRDPIFTLCITIHISHLKSIYKLFFNASQILDQMSSYFPSFSNPQSIFVEPFHKR